MEGCSYIRTKLTLSHFVTFYSIYGSGRPWFGTLLAMTMTTYDDLPMDVSKTVMTMCSHARGRLAAMAAFPEWQRSAADVWTETIVDEQTFDDLLETLRDLAALGPVRRMTSLEVTVRQRERSWGNTKALELLCGIIDSCSDELDHVIIEFPPESIDMPTAQCAELLRSLARLPAATFVSVGGLVLAADDLRDWGSAARPFPDYLVIKDCGLRTSDVGRTRPVLTFDAFHGRIGIAHVRLHAQYRQDPVVIAMIATSLPAHVYHSLDPEDVLDCYWNVKLDFAFSYPLLLLEVL